MKKIEVKCTRCGEIRKMESIGGTAICPKCHRLMVKVTDSNRNRQMLYESKE